MNRHRLWATMGALLAFAAFATTANAQTIDPRLQIRPTPQVLATVVLQQKMTAFKPEVHGFKFANTFRNNFVSEFDIRTGGLCGGMVYTALDYFTANQPIPQQSWLPTEGSTLQSYIYNRQVKSLARNLHRWAEFHLNPGGARNDEFWRWGLEGKPGGRIAELKARIDKGQPVPLGLLGCNEGCKGDHQVLAIGYQIGRYKGDLGDNIADFKIFVYDPNFPNQMKTMVANVVDKKFQYEGDAGSNWRSYLVDPEWRVTKPPQISALQREVLVTMETGEDDLRGGNDNVNLMLYRSNGPELTFRNVNTGKRWIMNSTQTVAVELPLGTSYDQITGVKVQHTGPSSGVFERVGADNWDLRSIRVETGDADGKRLLMRRSGSPAHRFTMAARDVLWNFGDIAAARELVALFVTGSDDLRGGNDNVHLVLLLRNGRTHRYENVNGRRKWENGASVTVRLPLPEGVTYAQISGVRVETTFSGGMGGDNWNLQWLNVGTVIGHAPRSAQCLRRAVATVYGKRKDAELDVLSGTTGGRCST